MAKFLGSAVVVMACLVLNSWHATECVGQSESNMLYLENSLLKVGVDRSKGGSITFLGLQDTGKNLVNVADPGRLIQQSYYAGKILDRRADGQHPAWSPWSWNPIQGGGVGKAHRGKQQSSSKGTWAGVLKFEKKEEVIFSESIPKLWDMDDEDAAARMRQWTSFEKGLSNVITVRCEFAAKRVENDRWGAAVDRPQEIPACYFTREFDRVMSYLGDGKWRLEASGFGKPWNKLVPPQKTVALFNSDGLGVALFSPTSDAPWNFGPHGPRQPSGSNDGPCMHVAAIGRMALGPKSLISYRYWLLVGNQNGIAASADQLWTRYEKERLKLTSSQ